MSYDLEAIMAVAREELPQFGGLIRMAQPFLKIMSPAEKERISDALDGAIAAVKAGDEKALWEVCKGFGPLALPAFEAGKTAIGAYASSHD